MERKENGETIENVFIWTANKSENIHGQLSNGRVYWGALGYISSTHITYTQKKRVTM